MNKEKYLEKLDQVINHVNHEIELADNNSKRYTVDVAKYLHSEDPQNIEIRENAYLNYKVCEGKKMKICPKCGSNKVIIFDSDNDICQKCDKWFPALKEEKCHKECWTLKNKEIRHHKNCIYYKDSLSETIDIYRDHIIKKGNN